MITVIIPSFRYSPHLKGIISRLLEQTKKPEIIVVIDEPTEKARLLEKQFKSVKFIFNEKRKGKARAVNETAKLASGDILVFLDDDIEIEKDDFIENIEKEIKDYDMLDIKKVVIKDSLLARMTYYEYLGFNIGAYMFSRFVGKCPAVNGSAFAIKKDKFFEIGGFRGVIIEDVDIATRGFLKNFKFAYTKDAYIKNHVPSTWHAWLKQRKRWTTGNALWLKEWWRKLLPIIAKKPLVVAPTLIFLFPAIIIFTIHALIPNFFFYKIAFFVFFLFAIKFSILLPIIMLSTLGAEMIGNVVALIISAIAIAFFYYIFARKLGFKFRISEFMLYYFFYSIIYFLLVIVSIIRVFVFKRHSVSDWKT